MDEKFIPRGYQKPIMKALKKFNRSVIMGHRRCGKDIICWNHMIQEALRERGQYYYTFMGIPFARKIIFNGVTNEGKRFLDYIPKDNIEEINKDLMVIKLTNGSIIQLVGADKSFRGLNAKGVVFSEFSLYDDKNFSDLLEVILARDGWVVYNGTPRQKGSELNPFLRLYNQAVQLDDWYDCRIGAHLTGIKFDTEFMSEEEIELQLHCNFKGRWKK